MKQKLLLLSVLLTMVAFTYAQTTYLDFESNESPIGYVFGGNAYTPGVDNPNTTGNTSAKVGEVITGNETWSGHAMPVGGTIGFSATDTTFTMDVLSDVTGDVLMKLENSANTNQFVEVSAAYTNTGEWQTLTYNFPDTLEAGLYNQIVLFFNFGATDATTWYFDNIAGPEPTYAGDVTVAMNIEDKLEVATTVGLTLNGEEVTLTQDGKFYTAEKVLSPYTMVNGGGNYEAIITVDGAAHDTTTISVTGGDATMTWNYIILIEAPEDGTALAVNVGDTPPTIDGVMDDIWGNAKAHPLQQREWWGSATGLYSYFKIMWVLDNVYILNYVDDATPYNSAPAETPYENDNVEIFFDMDQSASAGFDANDWQIRAIRGVEGTWTGSANVESADWSTAERAQTALAVDAGYIVEWAIPWTTLSSSFLPLAESSFNFDVVVADVADDAGRDYIIAWSTNADQNYNNTSLYGTITLTDETSEVTSIRAFEQVEFSVYPNPANNRVSVSTKDNIASIQVIDITGKVVAEKHDLSSPVASMDVSKLANGIYLIKVSDDNGRSGVQKLHVK